MKATSFARIAALGCLLFLSACTSDPSESGDPSGSGSFEAEFSLGEPEVVTSGFMFTEGPHWLDEGSLDDGSLLFSDIPAGKVYQWRPGSSESTVFIDSSGAANGIDELPDGTLVLAQHAGRVSRADGSTPDSLTLTPIVSEYQGKRLNSPNDLAVRSDAVIFFTDPTFGVSEENQELSFAGVYRVDPGGALTLMYDDFALPNGVALSPDESVLYVSDSETGDVMRFDVLENGDLEHETLFANVGARTETGAADGMLTDSDGRLYTTGPNGLMGCGTNGETLATLDFGQQVTNLAWDENETTLFVTSVADVFRVDVTR